MNTLIFRTVAPFLTALMLLFSIFVLLRDTMSRAYTHAGQQAVTGFWHVSEALVPARDRKRIAALGKDVG